MQCISSITPRLPWSHPCRLSRPRRSARRPRPGGTGGSFRLTLLSDAYPGRRLTIATIADADFNALHLAATGHAGHFENGRIGEPRHRLAGLWQHDLPAQAPPVITEISNGIREFFRERTTIYGGPLQGSRVVLQRFVDTIIDEMLVVMNDPEGGLVAQPRVLQTEPQRLVDLGDHQGALFTESLGFPILLDTPSVRGTSYNVIFDQHIKRQGRARYAPLCVVEAVAGDEDPGAALTRGVLAAAALGLRYGLPLVNGIATNLVRWFFFSVDDQGVDVSEHIDVGFENATPEQAALERVVTWIYASVGILVRHG